MADTSEPVCNIAGMGAELPMAVAVDSEFLPASRTGIGVDCFPLHQLQMCVPPLIPAGIAADMGSYRTVVVGFPFETIECEDSRNKMMSQVLDFFKGTSKQD